MKKVLIIDDESDARNLIREYLSPHSNFEITAECENGLEAVDRINTEEPDLIFLDIQMPGLNGFQVVQQIIHVPKIIFTTAYDQFAIKAFDNNAIDYLLKPYTSERFNQSLSKAAAYTQADFVKTEKLANEFTGQSPTRIMVESGNKMITLKVEDIFYFEAEKDYTRIHTASKSYLSNYGIGILEQRMDAKIFLRIHRSYIVNIHSIKEVHKEGYSMQVLLSNDKTLNVSRSYMEQLKKYFY
ncbi:MAG: response regulator transcription factor [Gemmatimonadaceae bacterium]|nr:response regulator transcription factor [Chitinophagaceae bacterium]